jgi:hypothetical protein
MNVQLTQHIEDRKVGRSQKNGRLALPLTRSVATEGAEGTHSFGKSYFLCHTN